MPTLAGWWNLWRWKLMSHLNACLYPSPSVNLFVSDRRQSGLTLSLLHISKKGALGAEGKPESDPILQTCLALTQSLAPAAQSLHRQTFSEVLLNSIKCHCWKGHWEIWGCQVLKYKEDVIPEICYDLAVFWFNQRIQSWEYSREKQLMTSKEQHGSAGLLP